MSKQKQESTTPPTIIILTLPTPEADEIPCQGSILAKYESADSKQNLAHLMPFTFSSIEDITRAIQSAQTQLEALKANPPQVVLPEPEAKQTKASSKASKPKKKKVSLNDIPEDDDFDEEDVNNSDMVKEIDNPSIETLKVGQVIQLGDNTLDVDDEPIEFTKGRVVEVDWDADAPRVWLESLDGEQDAWLPLDALAKDKMPVTARETAIGTGIPNKEGQLTLFS